MIFAKTGVTPNWLHSISNGEVYIFDDYGIISVVEIDGVTVINSGTVDDGGFTLSMFKVLRGIVSKSERVIASSSLKHIVGFEKYGLEYDDMLQAFVKGA